MNVSVTHAQYYHPCRQPCKQRACDVHIAGWPQCPLEGQINGLQGQQRRQSYRVHTSIEHTTGQHGHGDDTGNDKPPHDTAPDDAAIHDGVSTSYNPVGTVTANEHACNVGAIHTYGEHDGANIILVVRDGQQCIQ